jgi:hypothetical protein
MAAEHLSVDELQAYASGALPPGELLRVSDHLAGCADCRRSVRSAAPAPSLASEEALTYEVLADYLDDQLDPMRRLEVCAQLQQSPRAAAELADLILLRDETNALPASGKVVRFPGTFTKWLLPLAALFLIGVGGFWWHAQQGRAGLVSNETLAGLPPDLRATLTTALKTGHLKIPSDIESLGRKHEILAGPPNEKPGFALVQPRATAIRDLRPHFAWTPRAGASSYRVLVVEMETGDLVANGKSNGTTWQPTAPLVAGEAYQWQVEALRGTEVIERVPRPPAPEARFAILTAQARADFEKIDAQNKGAHLVLAVAAAQVGLLQRAEEELRALAQENPQAKLPNEFLAQVEQARAAGK